VCEAAEMRDGVCEAAEMRDGVCVKLQKKLTRLDLISCIHRSLLFRCIGNWQAQLSQLLKWLKYSSSICLEKMSLNRI
jgi:hypothetical protein